MSKQSPTENDDQQLALEALNDGLGEDPSGEGDPDDSPLPSDQFPPLDNNTLEKCRQMTPQEIALIDKDIVEKGMFLFFSNEFKAAEDLFLQHYQSDPTAAMGYGTLATIKAVLSLEVKDIDEACNRLLYSMNFALKVGPKGKGVIGSVVGFATGFFRKQNETFSQVEFRALVANAESELLRAVLLLLQDSYMAYIKAGLALRRGYNMYDRLQKHITANEKKHNADANSIYGMHFGLGAILFYYYFQLQL